MTMYDGCKRPPPGWVCHLPADHDGPCPTFQERHSEEPDVIDVVIAAVTFALVAGLIGYIIWHLTLGPSS